MKKGKLVVLSGFSGAGKGTIVKILQRDHDSYVLSVSMTTRAPRAEDQEGVTYFFVTREQFEERIREGGMMEYAQYVDNYYGTPRFFVEEQQAAGRDVILEIEAQGAMQIKAQAPDAVMVYLVTPSAAELEARLIGRGTETREKIAGRLQQALTEISAVRHYDYMVINDDREAAAALMDRLVREEPDECRPDPVFLERFRRELEEEILPRYKELCSAE